MQVQKPRQHETRGTRPDNSNLRPHKLLSGETSSMALIGSGLIKAKDEDRKSFGEFKSPAEHISPVAPVFFRELGGHNGRQCGPRAKRLRINTTYAGRKH